MEHPWDVDALVAAAGSGDAAAQSRIMTTYLPLARSRARRLVDDHHAVDDVVQEAFVEVFATLHRLREPRALPAWVCLAVRKHADRHRRSRRPAAALSELNEPPLVDDDQPERTEITARIHAALAAASDGDRRLLELRYLADWTVGELADLHGVSEGAIRKRLHDARRRLRPTLTDLHQRKEPTMTNHEELLAKVYAPGTLDLGDPPRVVRPSERQPIATGLKIIDALAPVSRGGTVEMVGPVGTGHLVLVLELAERLNRNEREPAVVAAGSRQPSGQPGASVEKLVSEVEDNARNAVVIGDAPDDAASVLRDAHALARGLAAEQIDVLFVVDRATADGAGGPTALKDLAGSSPGGGSITLILLDAYERGAPLPADAGMDTRLVFSLQQMAAGIFPALDPVASHAKFDTSPLGDELRSFLLRADEVRRFFAQPMVVAQDHTGEAPTWVDRADAEATLRELIGTS
jgi:RNA polymerase sigma-70 factor (ECF subfamily)